jgi:O-Antigen ligase
MKTNTIAQVRLPRGFQGFGGSDNPKAPEAPERLRSLVVWIALIGIFSPPILISLGSVSVTPGRFVVIMLLVPAIQTLLGKGRNRVTADFCAVALAAWMLGSSASNGGFTPYVGAEALEFLGAYLVGRAFVFGSSNLTMFVWALKRITVVLIGLALLDTLSGRYVTLDSFGITSILAQRLGLVRAVSVFDGSEHYGTFCVAAASILFYSEQGANRVLYVGLCYLGCALSLSSGPFMGLGIITAVFCYDCALRQFPWRWKALAATATGILIGIFIFASQPLEWILLHFTLDPETGFFRLLTWESALPLISQSPFVGYGMVSLGDSLDAQIYLRSVDCIWLLAALRYGLPAVILLIMTMFSSLSRKSSALGTVNIETGLSLCIVTMALIGLTVHFWGATWLFLSLCIGIRASVTEYQGRQMKVLSRSRTAGMRS